MSEYAGSEWVKASLNKEMSPLGEVVADLLGSVWQGIYHIDESALNKVEWDDPYHVAIVVYGDLATVDFNRLTSLVVLAHDAMLRVSIEGCGPNYMRLRFHQRKVRDGSLSERCPTIEDHINQIRRWA